MNNPRHQTDIHMLPIDRIHILNPRVRSQKIFKEITDNIAKVGLKRPITVVRGSSQKDKDYDLVCGQGRIEAFLACNQIEIPAIIIEASEEETLIMSLVENIARRQHRAVDLLHGVEQLHKNGYESREIATKTGLGFEYVVDILNLLQRGEKRLIQAVETGTMPMSLAIKICDAPDEDQKLLQEAHQTNQLSGNRLLIAKRVLEQRRRRGKDLCDRASRMRTKPRTVNDVVAAYKKEVDRKFLLVRKAEFTAHRLTVVVEGLRRLLKQEHFVDLLRAEDLTSMPKCIADLLEAGRS